VFDKFAGVQMIDVHIPTTDEVDGASQGIWVP